MWWPEWWQMFVLPYFMAHLPDVNPAPSGGEVQLEHDGWGIIQIIRNAQACLSEHESKCPSLQIDSTGGKFRSQTCIIWLPPRIKEGLLRVHIYFAEDTQRWFARWNCKRICLLLHLCWISPKMAAAGGVPFLHNKRTVAAGFSAEQPVRLKEKLLLGWKGDISHWARNPLLINPSEQRRKHISVW